jgi:hypothetical protein
MVTDAWYMAPPMWPNFPQLMAAIIDGVVKEFSSESWSLALDAVNAWVAEGNEIHPYPYTPPEV